MLRSQRLPQMYPVSGFNSAYPRTTQFPRALLDVNWTEVWPIITTIVLASIMLITNAAIIGLDIANLAIEGDTSNGSSLGANISTVGAGIWSGSISFIAAFFIFVISMYFLFEFKRISLILFNLVFVRNKRIAATFALIAVGLAFLFDIVLIGLTANGIQMYNFGSLNLQNIQSKLIIAELSLAAFDLILYIIFFIIYISVFFSSHTRQPTKF